MKKLILAVTVCLASTSVMMVQAQEIDLLSDELLATKGVSDETSGVSSVDNALVIDEGNGEKKESIFGMIVQPITDWLFSSKDDINVIAEGEEETVFAKTVRLANEGDLEAQMSLGYMYLYGTNGISKNSEEAFKYYSMAARQEDPIALNNLGSLYFNGLGTEKNIKHALDLFEKAAELGNDNAAVNLGFIYLTGGAKDEKRNNKAMSLFEQAANSGNKIAQFMLGYAYYKGFGVDVDSAKAFRLVKAAATGKGQIDEAQIILGEMYTNGYGTVQNYKNAMQAYQSAAQQGNLEAVMKLAALYETGEIGSVNPVMAHALYNIAASQDVEGAAEKRESLKPKLTVETLPQAQNTAQNYKATPSELTTYIRQTYGKNLRYYIDNNIVIKRK